MRRATRQLLWLVGLAAAAGIATLAQVRHEQSQWPEPLTSLDISTVRSIQLSCPSCIHQRYLRIDGGWRMSVPQDQPADPKRIENLLAIAQSAVRSRRSIAELDPAKLGLQPAQAILQLDNVTIAFGHLDVIDGDRYVRVDSQDQIALVPDRFSQHLFAPVL